MPLDLSDPGALTDRPRVAEAIGKVRTQYREAERMLAYFAAVLSQIDDAINATTAIPSFFDLDTAVGDQLTKLGKRLGFPRCHCVCDATPLVGFACSTPLPGPPVVGFCGEGTWRGCGGVSSLCISDDEAYRGHLKARRYQMLGLYDLPSLGAALRSIWGPTAWIPQAQAGRVVLAPGRDLTPAEAQRFSITLRVLPIAPTMEIAAHFGAAPIAGFGVGWAGFCTPGSAAVGNWLCPAVIDPYGCETPAQKAVIGFEALDTDTASVGFGEANSTWLACQ